MNVSNIFYFLCLDTLELYLVVNEFDFKFILIFLKKKGIVWWIDKNVKFRNLFGKESFEEKFKGKI